MLVKSIKFFDLNFFGKKEERLMGQQEERRGATREGGGEGKKRRQEGRKREVGKEEKSKIMLLEFVISFHRSCTANDCLNTF